jgi:hypothetical protein
MHAMAVRDENLRVRVEDPTLSGWWAALEAHNISNQKALLALIEFALEQDPLTRSMIFKQVPQSDNAALAKIVLDRLATKSKRK